jgi:hypothetical protein
MKSMHEHAIRITDIHLAAFLLAKGYPVAQVIGPQGRREFVFHDVPDGIILTFYGGPDAVSARALFDALRNVRGLVSQPLAEARR